jgi:pimeloyl-ACP methyl ester carboxylesterase
VRRLLLILAISASAQQAPFDVFPDAEAPYYRVRYAPSDAFIFGVNYTIWIPENVKTLRGLIVHQHGCGEGSCKSGLTGAFDLHWQALARKHDCALLAPAYEQPQDADCQMWCDPRNGSDSTFRRGLADLARLSEHPELTEVPWALWGHSGGGHWAGGMLMLHPERVAAVWLRSGVPLFEPNPKRPQIEPHTLPAAALQVPVMCNPGTQEGVTVTSGRFAGVWPANETFFRELRSRGGLVGVAIDPLSSHECGNQRYLAIPWFDVCLSQRLGQPLKPMPAAEAWLAPLRATKAEPASTFSGDPLTAIWLPNAAIAQAWTQYISDTAVVDNSPPPTPTHLTLTGNQLSWQAAADLESGLAHFIIRRDGAFLAQVPKAGKNRFGRPIFQGLQYSDTPTQPLVPMQFSDTSAKPGQKHRYQVIAVNTVGLKSPPCEHESK